MYHFYIFSDINQHLFNDLIIHFLNGILVILELLRIFWQMAPRFVIEQKDFIGSRQHHPVGFDGAAFSLYDGLLVHNRIAR